MVWFQRRSSMTLKARPSTFDTLERASSFDTIAVLPGNRPMAPPAVVEDVAPGLIEPIADEAQTQRPRRSRGRFFGLMLRLPLFGSRGENHADASKLASKNVGVWRQCQTASDNSDDERGMSRQRLDGRAQHMPQYPAADWTGDHGMDNGGEVPFAQTRPRLAVRSMPRYDGPEDVRGVRNSLEHTFDQGVIPREYVRHAQSVDIAGGLRPGDPRVVPFRWAKVPNLGTVKEGLAGVGSKPRDSKESKSGRWTERASRASRQISSVANRLRRRSRELRRKSRENDPDSSDAYTGRASADYPGGHQAKRMAERDRRKSMGVAMGGNGDVYDIPGPEGPRCPPDNLYIPSGPPDNIYVPTGDDHSRSMESPMAQMPMVSSESRSGTAASLYANRWSCDHDYVVSSPMAIWDHDGNPIDQGLAGAADQSLGGADIARPSSSAAGYRSGDSRGVDSADFRRSLSCSARWGSDSRGLESADFCRPQSSAAAYHSSEGQGMVRADFRRPSSSAASYRNGDAEATPAGYFDDPVSQDSTAPDQCPHRRRGLDVSRPGQQQPPKQFPSRRAPVEWDYESAGTPCKSSNNSSEVASGGSHSRARRPRKDTMAMKIFGAASYADAPTSHFCDVVESAAPLVASVDYEPSSRPHTPLLEDNSEEPSPRRASPEPEPRLHELHVPTRCTPETGAPSGHEMAAASLDSWSLPWDDLGRKTAGSVTQSEYDDVRPAARPSNSWSRDARPPVRPSISLSEDARPRPSISLSDTQYAPPCNRPESYDPEGDRLAGNCSAASFRGRDHVDVTASYSSDGPLYHRSMFFQSGFSSAEESDDDIDDARCTPSQFVLNLKPRHLNRRWHSDALKGVCATHDDYDDPYRSPSHITLGRMERLSDIRSDYSRSYEGYPARPGYSFRSGYESDLVLPEFHNIGGRGLHGPNKDEPVKKVRKTWLDELQESADLRRKECTYRIACQRAILQNMKETLQASKLALDRIKSGLCPHLTSKVAQLRRRWGGKQRSKRREKLVKAMKREEDNVWDDFSLPISGCGLFRSSPKPQI